MNCRPVAGSQRDPSTTPAGIEIPTPRIEQKDFQKVRHLLKTAKSAGENTPETLEFFRTGQWDERTNIVGAVSGRLSDAECGNKQLDLLRALVYLDCAFDLAKVTRENVGKRLEILNGPVDEARSFAVLVGTQAQEIQDRKRKVIELSATEEKQIAKAGGIPTPLFGVYRELATQKMREASDLRARDLKILQEHLTGQDIAMTEYCSRMAETWNQLRREEWLDFDTYLATTQKLGGCFIGFNDLHQELWTLQVQARKAMGCFQEPSRAMPIFFAVDYEGKA
ncbi:hypothetical protein V8F33_001151 [Rhypophila sp. PSN 637]